MKNNEGKIPDVSNLATKSNLNTKIMNLKIKYQVLLA